MADVAMADSGNAHIVDLVKQLRNGDIDRKQLLDALHDMQKEKKAQTAVDTGVDSSQGERHHAKASSSIDDASLFSEETQDDELSQGHTRSHRHSNYRKAPSSHAKQHEQTYAEDDSPITMHHPAAHQRSEADEEAVVSRTRRQHRPPTPELVEAGDNNYSLAPDSSLAAPVPRRAASSSRSQRSASPAAARNMPQRGRASTPTNHRRVAGTPTSARRARPSSPSLRPEGSFSSVGARGGRGGEGSAQFYERVMAWAAKKDAETEERRADKKESELDGCTFRPEINNAETGRREENVVARLINSKVEKEAKIMQQKMRLEQEELHTECTFTPKINKRARDPTPVRSRYREPTPRRIHQQRGSVPDDLQPAERELTFKPMVNQIPEAMATARAYLSEPAFDRLSRPVRQPGGLEQQFSSDSFKGVSTPRGGGVARSDSRSSIQRSSSRELSDDFWKRQNKTLKAKETFIAEKDRQLKESRRAASPRLCRKSEQIVQERRRSSSAIGQSDKNNRTADQFLNRVQAELQKRQKEKENRSKTPVPGCTFKPSINPESRRMPARTIEDMSKGDIERRQAVRKAVAGMYQDEDLRTCSFQPAVLHNNQEMKNVPSRLAVNSDPETYLTRIESLARQQAESQKVLVEERRQKDMEECTFKPKVNHVPDFVKKIASSRRDIQKRHDCRHDNGPPPMRF